MCRSAVGCAIVFEAIYGKDPSDPTSVDVSCLLTANQKNSRNIKIGDKINISEFKKDITDRTNII